MISHLTSLRGGRADEAISEMAFRLLRSARNDVKLSVTRIAENTNLVHPLRAACPWGTAVEPVTTQSIVTRE